MLAYSRKLKNIALVFGALFVLAAIPLTVVLTLQGNPLVSKPQAATTATLSILPASKNLTQGQIYSFPIRENSGSDTVNAVQANLTYDDTKLQYIGVNDTGSAFPFVVQTTGGGGSVQIARAVTPGQPAVTGDQLVTTVKFKAKASSGSTNVTFAAGSAVASSVDNTNLLGSTNPGAYSFLPSHYWPGKDIVKSLLLKSDGSGGYVMEAFGGVHAFGNAPVIANNSHAYWNWQAAKDAVLRPGTTGGYIMDVYGGLHSFGGAPAVTASGYWPGWKIVRAVAILPDGSGGYSLDAYGGLHRFGAATAIANNTHAYWPGFDIARDVVLLPSATAGSPKGYILDGYGGIHPFGGAPAVTKTGYWGGFDIANALAMNAAGSGGYTLDGYGGLHTWGTGSSAVANNTHGYWPGWDIARDASLTGSNAGIILDGFGGLHSFGGATEF